MAHGLFELTGGIEKLPELTRLAGYAQFVAPAQHEVAVRDVDIAAAFDDADQHRRVYQAVQALQLYPVELFARKHAVLDDLHAAL